MNEQQKPSKHPGASDNEKGKGNGGTRDIGVIAYHLFETSISVFIPGMIVVWLYGSQLMELLGLHNHKLLEEAMKSSGFVSAIVFLIPAWILGWFVLIFGFLFPKFVLKPPPPKQPAEQTRSEGEPTQPEIKWTIIRFASWGIIYIIAIVVSNFPEWFRSTVSLTVGIAILLVVAVVLIGIDICIRNRKGNASECKIFKTPLEQLFPPPPYRTEAEEESELAGVRSRTYLACKQIFRSMVVISLFIPLLHPHDWPSGGPSLCLDFGLFFFSFLGWSLMHLGDLEAILANAKTDATPKA